MTFWAGAFFIEFQHSSSVMRQSLCYTVNYAKMWNLTILANTFYERIKLPGVSNLRSLFLSTKDKNELFLVLFFSCFVFVLCLFSFVCLFFICVCVYVWLEGKVVKEEWYLESKRLLAELHLLIRPPAFHSALINILIFHHFPSPLQSGISDGSKGSIRKYGLAKGSKEQLRL